MGISGYHEWLRQYFFDAIKRLQHTKSKRYEHILIDVNFILHKCLYTSKSRKDFIGKMFKMLDYVLSKFIPTKSLFLTIDGTSTFAKLLEQKKRREGMTDEYSDDVLSSLELTPGTKMMTEMENHLLTYIKHYESMCKFRKVECKVSSSKEPDEGEVKIFKEIKKIAEKNPYDNYLVIGNDADIVVLGLLATSSRNIDILFRNKNEMDIISINKIVNMARIKLELIQYPYNDQKTIMLRKDIALISILMGNDYLPKIAFTKNNVLWEAYAKYFELNKKYIYEVNKLNFVNFQKYLTILNQHIQQKYKNTECITDDKIIENYLTGLVWCIDSYSNGSTIDYEYQYDGDKNPSVYDLITYLNRHDEFQIKPITKGVPIPHEMYPLLVMPKKAKILIPERYHKLMDKEFAEYFYEDPKEIIDLKKELTNLRSTIIKRRKEGLDTEELRNNLKDKETHLKELKEKHLPKKFSISEIKELIKIGKECH